MRERDLNSFLDISMMKDSTYIYKPRERKSVCVMALKHDLLISMTTTSRLAAQSASTCCALSTSELQWVIATTQQNCRLHSEENKHSK
jgi:hypothetical protein